LTGQGYDFGNDKLGYTPGISEWGVEDSNSLLCSKVQVYLIRANTETSNHQQVLSLSQDLVSQPGLRSDANDMDVPVG
jgi:hypothetical protein